MTEIGKTDEGAGVGNGKGNAPFIIAGLGNPGRGHENDRHNIGFGVVDMLAAKHGIQVKKLRHRACKGEGFIKGQKVVLLKPQTFMNLSGESISSAVEWYKAPLGNLLVICDDIDLPLGKIRIRRRGSSGTHNGLKSVIYMLQDDNFSRIRIGIGKPPEQYSLADYVLGKFGDVEADIVEAALKQAAEACELIITEGIQVAMNRFNGINLNGEHCDERL